VRPSDFAACLVTQFAHRGRIGFRAVGDDRLGLAVALQRFAHEPQSCRFIAGFGDVAFQHLTLVIHCAPQVVRLAVDLYVDLIEVPPPVAESPHAADQPLDVSSEHRPEPVPPKTNSLVANVDPALEHEVLDVTQRKREANIHHHYEALTSGEEWK
jgi:hypothetical protein